MTEDLGESGARFRPRVLAELGAVGDDEVLEAVGARARQLLVVLLDAPLEMCVEVVDEHVADRLEVLREHVNDGVQRMIARGRHPLGFLYLNNERTHVFQNQFH